MSDDLDRPSPWQKWAILLLLTVVVFFPLLGAGWIWITLHYAYSKGERAGYIQKISQKGWICKTWEGELAMANLPGTLPEIFQFSVRDPDVAAELERNAGQRVALTYEQHRGVPSACFGETEYFIVHVTPFKDASQMQPPVMALPPAAKK